MAYFGGGWGDPTGVGSYGGYPGSNHWSADSRPLSNGTEALRSFVITNIVQENRWEIDRITRYYLFQKFYDGYHFKDFNDGLISFNYIRAFIDKVIMFLLGDEAFSFSVKSCYSDQVDTETERDAEQLLMYHWNKSKKLQITYEILQMGSIMGDCWVGLDWQSAPTDRYFKIRLYDSRQSFCKFKNGDYNTLEKFLIRQPLSWDGERQPYRLFVTQFTNEYIETWYQRTVSIDEKQIEKENYVRQENPYGFIPVVHIKNRPNASGYYGKSDANDILKLNKVYNEIMQQLKAVIDYHVTPTTVITGASAKSLKKGLGQIWSGLPAEANVFNLGLDVDLNAATTFAKDLKTAMHELSDVPENALGKIQAISNTSAAALQITYHPLIQQANIKALTYGEGFTELNAMLLRMLSIVDPENVRLKRILDRNPNFLSEMRVVPVFAYGFPKDKMDELQRAEIELRLKLGSRKEIMERLGKQNVQELLQEVDEDFLHLAELTAEGQAYLNIVNNTINGATGEGAEVDENLETDLTPPPTRGGKNSNVPNNSEQTEQES